MPSGRGDWRLSPRRSTAASNYTISGDVAVPCAPLHASGRNGHAPSANKADNWTYPEAWARRCWRRGWAQPVPAQSSCCRARAGVPP